MARQFWGPTLPREVDWERWGNIIAHYGEQQYPNLRGLHVKVNAYNQGPKIIFEVRGWVGENNYVYQTILQESLLPMESVMRMVADNFLAHMNTRLGTIPDEILIDLLSALL